MKWVAKMDWIIEVGIASLQSIRPAHHLTKEHQMVGTLVNSSTSGILM